MDQLGVAAVERAHAALNVALRSETRQQKVAAFVAVARALGATKSPQAAIHVMERSPDPLVERIGKAAAITLTGELGPEARDLAASFVASIAQFSLLDSLAKYARVIPETVNRTLIASDAVGDITTEGAPKPVINLGFDFAGIERTKSTAIVVLSEEFQKASGEDGQRLIEQELGSAVNRAVNTAVVDHYTNTSMTQVGGTGDALTDLRAGLKAAGASTGYVVAAPATDTADLATRVENRGGMSVRGGTFVPGVEIVAVDDLSGMLILPASRVALRDFGLEIRGAGQATVDMRDTPQSPAQQVSLWQTNCWGVIAERLFALGGDAVAVKVG
jgi:hypothetical protein